jgi:hypothetical protein
VRRSWIVFALVAVWLAPGRPAMATGTWTWPVRGPVIRGFDPPTSPYGAGHRGIDIATVVGTPVAAPASGVVSFAGAVAGSLFVSIDHGGGVVSTCSFLSAILVAKGDAVVAGQPVGLSGTGHAGATVPHLHFGVRLDGVYVDPMMYLGPINVSDFIRLAPLDDDPSDGSGTLGWRGFAPPTVSLDPSWSARAPVERDPLARAGPDRVLGLGRVGGMGATVRLLA